MWKRFKLLDLKLVRVLTWIELITFALAFCLEIGSRWVTGVLFVGTLLFELPSSFKAIRNAEYELEEAQIEKSRRPEPKKNALPILSQDPAMQISFSVQPQDCVAATGEEVAFTAVAEEDLPHRQWQVSQDAGKTWWDMPDDQGGQADTLRFVAESHQNGFLYRCVLWDDMGKSGITRNAELILREESES